MAGTTLARLAALRADSAPLERAREMVERLGRPLGPADLVELARVTGVPVAALRAAVSSYADLAQGPAEARVCVGTSCALAGGERLAADLATRTSVRTVHCLGHCDRSPAVLLRDGRVVAPSTGADATGVLETSAGGVTPPSVRARSRVRIVTRRLGRGAFAELERARADGAYSALEKALRLPPEALLADVERSGLRGRGGAGFPTGRKWRRAAQAAGDVRYVVANGDEGDPGSFIDRLLMEEDPHGVLEGMLLCAYAVGAGEGIAFVRSEYPDAAASLRRAVVAARAAGILGEVGARLRIRVRRPGRLRARQLCLRRGDRPAGGAGGAPLRGAPAPPVSGGRRAARAADGRGQRRDPRQRARGSSSTARTPTRRSAPRRRRAPRPSA